MNDKLKKIIVPFVVMAIFNSGLYHLGISRPFGEGFSPCLGLPVISGLLFGPYGALGSTLGMILGDVSRGYGPIIWAADIITFGISYLAYKLWYSPLYLKHVITKPRLNNTSNIILFLVIIISCSIIYNFIFRKLVLLIYPDDAINTYSIIIRYIVNFINFSFIFGIIGIWLSKRIDFVHVPKVSAKKYDKRIYQAIAIIGILFYIIMELVGILGHESIIILLMDIIVLTILVFAYTTKPITKKIEEITFDSIPETIMTFFFATTLIIVVFGSILSSNPAVMEIFRQLNPIKTIDMTTLFMLQIDGILVIFFIPSLVVIRFIEKRVLEPIISFSKIEKIIKKGNKIESKDLTDTYVEYLNQNDEIGMLARSYTNLINFGNDYIEDIRKNEIEKERYNTELSIAERIQKSTLPTGCIEEKDYTINGISKPAKTVGGDFYDYYPLDEDNVAVMIGDASGKGVPAALLSAITQSIIKQLLKTERDPSKVLYQLNNQLCENNPESMFITLWVGVYNNKTKVMTYSNAGHPAPLTFKDGKWETLNANKSLVAGIIENYEYKTEEAIIADGILAYSDGITDAKNSNDEFYGKDRLINYLNTNPFENNIITNLLKDIEKFSDSKEQYDDMTIVLLDKHN